MAKAFKDLTEREILALAISSEEDDARIYGDVAEGLQADFPATARMFREMQREETGHRHSLTQLFRQRFGEHIPLIRRDDVKGFIRRKPVWLVRPLGLNVVRKHAAAMEAETRNFYTTAAKRVSDVGVRALLDDLAEIERGHESQAEQLERD